MSYTIDTLLEDFKASGSIPTSVPLSSSNSNLIRVMNRVLKTKIVPLIKSVRADYLVDHIDYEIDPNSNEGYSIPPYAVGMSLKNIVVITDSSRDIYFSPPLLNIEQRAAGSFNLGTPGYYIEGNKVYLFPVGSFGNQTLRLYFLRTPNELISSSDCGQIEDIDTNTNTITLDAVPSDWVVGDFIDVVSNEPGFDCEARRLEILSISSQDVEVDSVEDLTVGSWACPTGYSCIAQTPAEIHELLVVASVAEYLKTRDPDLYQILMNEYENKKNDILDLITPRTEEKLQRITTNGNGIGDSFDWWWWK